MLAALGGWTQAWMHQHAKMLRNDNANMMMSIRYSVYACGDHLRFKRYIC